MMLFRNPWVLGGLCFAQLMALAVEGRDIELHEVGILTLQALKSSVMISEQSSGPTKSYIFSRKQPGLFLVVVSDPYASPKDSKSRGSRTFFLFPRQQPVAYELSGDNIVLRTASGHEIVFSGKSGRIVHMEGVAHREDPRANLHNNGGVEITSLARGLLLDAGWSMGGTAMRLPNRSSVFRDPRGNSCTVRNSEIFMKKDDDEVFRFPTDEGLADFLKKNCPALDLSSLKKSQPEDDDPNHYANALRNIERRVNAASGKRLPSQENKPAEHPAPAGGGVQVIRPQ